MKTETTETKAPALSIDLVAAARRSEKFPEDIDPEVAAGRYARFLALSQVNPDRSLAPTADIDEMWHLHMLHPVAYWRDCNVIFGELLDHDGGFGATEEEKPILDRLFAETASLWQTAYGEPYISQNVTATKCTRNCVSRCTRACKTGRAA